jgi:hypothetical protein
MKTFNVGTSIPTLVGGFCDQYARARQGLGFDCAKLKRLGAARPPTCPPPRALTDCMTGASAGFVPLRIWLRALRALQASEPTSRATRTTGTSFQL